MVPVQGGRPRIRRKTKRVSAFGASRALAARRVAEVVVAGWIAWSSTASADNPLNSSEKPPSSGANDAQSGGKNDGTIVPAVGGSTDIGVAGGYFAALTRTQKGYVPYVWNLESAGLVSFGLSHGSVDVPLVDIYGKLTVPRFLGRPIELEVRPSFTDEQTLYYYGMGDASGAATPAGQSSTYFQYARIHPSLLADIRFKLLDHLGAITGLRYTGSWLQIPAGTMLAHDIQSGSSEVKSLIGPTTPSVVALFMYGVQLDTRDSEISAHSGMFDEAIVKWSPGSDNTTFPFRYGEACLNLRGYVPLASKITLAGRVVGDVLFGNPPFAELPRFDDTYFGGDIRGVPAQRYYGKVKIIGNLEVRASIFSFHALSKPMSIGLEGFFDGGRVWADTGAHPQLDGTGLGLKYGVGGGVRLSSGTAFVLRADVAWSPDATPVGAYVTAGEMF